MNRSLEIRTPYGMGELEEQHGASWCAERPVKRIGAMPAGKACVEEWETVHTLGRSRECGPETFHSRECGSETFHSRLNK